MAGEVKVSRHLRHLNRVRDVIKELRENRPILKTHETKRSTRIRLVHPSQLRKRGYRFRLVLPSAAKGLTEAERKAIKKAHGKVVLGIRGPSVGRKARGFKPQAVVIPK